MWLLQGWEIMIISEYISKWFLLTKMVYVKENIHLRSFAGFQWKVEFWLDQSTGFRILFFNHGWGQIKSSNYTMVKLSEFEQSDSVPILMLFLCQTDTGNISITPTHWFRVEKRNARLSMTTMALMFTLGFGIGRDRFLSTITFQITEFFDDSIRGYKAAGLILSLSVPDELANTKPEYLWNISWSERILMDYQLQWNLSAFIPNAKTCKPALRDKLIRTILWLFCLFHWYFASGSNYGTDFCFSGNWQFKYLWFFRIIKAGIHDFVTSEGVISMVGNSPCTVL